MDEWASAAFVLRHGCPGKDIAIAAQLIGDFAYVQQSWEQVFSSNVSEREVLRCVRVLCARDIADNWIHCFCSDCVRWGSSVHGHTYMDLAAERGLLSVVRFLHEHGNCGFTSNGVTKAAANGHVKVIKFLMERLGDDRERAVEAMGQAVEHGQVEVVEYLLAQGQTMAKESPSRAAKGGHLPLLQYLWQQDKDQARMKCTWGSGVPNMAAASGHVHVVKWLYDNTPFRCTLTSFLGAAKHGNLQMIQLLFEHCSSSVPASMIQKMTDQAADGNHLELMRFLEARGGDIMTARAMDGAARHSNLEFLKHLHTHSTRGCTAEAMEGAAENGHLDIVQFLHEQRHEECTPRTMELAAGNGHLHVVTYLHEVGGVELSLDAVIQAVHGDQLHVVKYFHSHGAVDAKRKHAKTCIDMGFLTLLKYLCANGLTTLRAKDLKRSSVKDADQVCEFMVEYLIERHSAHPDDELNLEMADILKKMVKRGKLQQIQFLDARYDTSQVDCAVAINAAAKLGRLDMLQHFHARGYRDFSECMQYAVSYRRVLCVKFLYETCGFPCPHDAIDRAVGSGALALVQYLHYQCNATATPYAMKLAAQIGDLAIVQFLHEHRSEGCDASAMDEAAMYGHLDMVKYLHFHAHATCTTDAMDQAAARGHLAVVQFLHEHRSEGCTTIAMDHAASNGHLDAVKFLHENRSEGCTLTAIMAAARCARLDIIEYLDEHRPECCLRVAMDAAKYYGQAQLLKDLKKRIHSCPLCEDPEVYKRVVEDGWTPIKQHMI